MEAFTGVVVFLHFRHLRQALPSLQPWLLHQNIMLFSQQDFGIFIFIWNRNSMDTGTGTGISDHQHRTKRTGNIFDNPRKR
ncbi:hypothetical protein F5Y13DRAFT_9704 [Hypoxylon sp. FL1857]|nr:hypothetical protein F5Y13DRAFT_9704 [Hypoxylon sp. FL1857]